jgi:hypothetical protein
MSAEDVGAVFLMGAGGKPASSHSWLWTSDAAASPAVVVHCRRFIAGFANLPVNPHAFKTLHVPGGLPFQVVDLHAAFFERDELGSSAAATPSIPSGATQLERLQLQLDVAASNSRAIRTMSGLELLGLADAEDTALMASQHAILQSLRRVVRAAAGLPRLRRLRLGRQCSAALRDAAAAGSMLLGLLPPRVRLELSVPEEAWSLSRDGVARDASAQAF